MSRPLYHWATEAFDFRRNQNGGSTGTWTLNLSGKSRVLCQLSYTPVKLVPWARIELATRRLSAVRSTTELSRQNWWMWDGFEPPKPVAPSLQPGCFDRLHTHPKTYLFVKELPCISQGIHIVYIKTQKMSSFFLSFLFGPVVRVRTWILSFKVQLLGGTHVLPRYLGFYLPPPRYSNKPQYEIVHQASQLRTDKRGWP